MKPFSEQIEESCSGRMYIELDNVSLPRKHWSITDYYGLWLLEIGWSEWALEL